MKQLHFFHLKTFSLRRPTTCSVQRNADFDNTNGISA